MQSVCHRTSTVESINDEPYRRLWATVLWQAVRDMNQESRALSARHYIFNKRNDPGSAQWICDMLDFDIYALQRLCMTRAGRSKILRNNGARRSGKKSAS